MAKTEEQIYRVEHVSKIFGSRYVLNDVDFEVCRGEVFGIIGSSGSGKTTLLNTLVGFIKVDKGDVKFRNVDMLNSKDAQSFRSIYHHQKELKKIYGFAAQNPSFYPNLTVIENLCYFGYLYNLSRGTIQSNAEYLLELVGLSQSQHIQAKNLSGGMKRRLDIACSLIHDPRILILDEPTADLDPMLSNKIWNFLRIINQRGTTIILASHHILDMENLCDRVAVLKEGRIVAIGKPEEIKRKNMPEESIYFRSQPGDYRKLMSELRKKVPEEIKGCKVQNKTLVIYTKDQSKVINNLLKAAEQLNEKIINIEGVKATLDKAFMRLSSDEEVVEKEEPEREGRKKNKYKKFKKKHKKHHHFSGAGHAQTSGNKPA